MRTVNSQLRRALEARDRGCRFPGCGARFTEAHHVVHWQDGGETTLDNCLLLCRRHHRAVHEGAVTVCLDVNGQVVFFTPKGKALAGAPPRRLPPPSGPGGCGFEVPAVTEWGGMPTYNHDRDIPWEEEARAWEAVDPTGPLQPLRDLKRSRPTPCTPKPLPLPPVTMTRAKKEGETPLEVPLHR